MLQNGYVENYQGNLSRRETRRRRQNRRRRRRNMAKLKRRKMHNARVQKTHVPFRPFYQRWSVTGYKHLTPHDNISRPTDRRWQLEHGRERFDVINKRRSTHCQNHRRRRASPISFRAGFRRRRANPISFRTGFRRRRESLISFRAGFRRRRRANPISFRAGFRRRRASPVKFRAGFHPCYFRMHPLKHKLSRMNHIIYWDIDNWSRFFEKLRFILPRSTFVWGFHGIKWKEPNRCLAFHRQIIRGGFQKNNQSGRTKNAADFAMMLQIGKMDEVLPNHVQFTIFSGDKGFKEAIHQMRNSERIIRILNPHVPGWQPRLHYILNQSIHCSR